MVFDSLRNLRGILYKRIKESEKQEIRVLPGFAIQKSIRMIDFPDIKDITKINITYSLIEPFAYAHIAWSPDRKELLYEVVEPQMTDDEKKMLKKISEGLIELVEVDLSAIKETGNTIKYLQKNIAKILKEFGIILTNNQYIKMMYYIYRNFVGFDEIEPLLQDPNIEDISCDGTDSPIYIIHRKYGSIKTNIIFSDLDYLREFVVKLSERTGRYVSYAEPILAGTLPDGSRISATLAGDVATHGPTFTIRKFSEKPFSPVEIMEAGTASSEVLAYFWYLMEHGISLLIVGGVATGKTSFLNTLAMFIPPESKIVSIEDTRELRLTHEHWIPGLARVGFGIPTPTGEKYGEVRGAEAYVMFQGMSSGHPSISTFHAGSIDTLIKRLTTPPIELSPTLIESLDEVAIMVHAKEKGKSARRVKEVFEVESVDAKTGEVNTRKIFDWDPVSDNFKKVGESIKVPKIVATLGGNMEQAVEEINRRQKILEWLKEKGIRDYLEVTKQINLYYKEPQKILDQIKDITIKPVIAKSVMLQQEVKQEPEKLPEQIPVQVAQVKKEQRKRTSILDLLGMKEIREKQ